MSILKNKWENFHHSKGSTQTALEWPDEYVVRAAKRWLNDESIKNILDLNCGGGRHSALLAQFDLNVFSSDLSMTALNQAKGLLKKRGANSNLINANSLILPFKSSFFDAVVFWRALHVFQRDDIPKVIAEIQRIIKPGGYILFSTRSNRNIYNQNRVGKVVPFPTDLSIDQIYEACSGLEVLNVELSEHTSNDRALRDSYWIVYAKYS